MPGPLNAFNTHLTPIIDPDRVHSSRSITPDISPSGGPTVNFPSLTTLPNDVSKYRNRVSGRKTPVVPFPLTKENAAPPKSAHSYNATAFDSPSYDTFFSGLPSAISVPPTSYEAQWNAGSFRSAPPAVHSPIGRPAFARSSNGFDAATLPSISLLSTTPSTTHSVPLLSRSLSSLADTSISPSLSVNHLVSFEDIQMDSPDPQYRTPSTKRKAMFQYVSAYPPPSTEFHGPNSKRVRIIPDSELPVLDKLDKISDFFKTLGWNTNEFLHHLFAPKSRTTSRSRRHGIIVEKFLSGGGNCSVAELLESWWTTADGSGYDSGNMYSVTTPYTQIGPVRSALSSFAAQIVEDQLLQEAETAVQDTSGQHASVTSKNEDASLRWTNIGATLIPTVKIALQTHQPLAFHYMCKIAEPAPPWRNGIRIVRTYRPPDLVSIDIF